MYQFSLCFCNRAPDDPVERAPVGTLFICSACRGVIRCDGCSKEDPVRGMGVAHLILAGKFTCRDHAWTVVAEREPR